MAIYYVYANGASPGGPNDVELDASGDLNVTSSGDTYIITNSVQGSFDVVNDSGTADNLDVTIEYASDYVSTSNGTLTIQDDLNATITVPDAVDLSTVDVSVPGTSSADKDNFTLNVGENAKIGNVKIEANGATSDLIEVTVNLGDGAEIGDGAGLNIPGSQLDVDINAGADVMIDGTLAVGGSNGSYDVQAGDNFTIDGNMTIGGSNNTQTVNIGDNFQLNGYWAMGGANNVNNVVFGENMTINSWVTGSTSGTESWEIGNGWSIGSSLTLQGGADTLKIGIPSPSDTSGSISGSGSLADEALVGTTTAEKQDLYDVLQAAGWTQDPTDPDVWTGGGSFVWKGQSYSGWERVTAVCFAAGTIIETEDGEIPVEQLEIGDLVKTADKGMQPIAWIGSRKLDEANLEASPNLRPIRIEAGALGDNKPEQDLTVSPQHRIVVSSEIAEKMFGEREILIAAHKLLPLKGVCRVVEAKSVDYYHFMFDRHHVVTANGTKSESLFAGPEALKALTAEQFSEVAKLFPELVSPTDQDCRPTPARVLAEGRKAKNLIARHIKNHKFVMAAE